MQAFEHLRLSSGESKKVLSLTVRISRHGKIRKSAGRTRPARVRRVGACGVRVGVGSPALPSSQRLPFAFHRFGLRVLALASRNSELGPPLCLSSLFCSTVGVIFRISAESPARAAAPAAARPRTRGAQPQAAHRAAAAQSNFFFERHRALHISTHTGHRKETQMSHHTHPGTNSNLHTRDDILYSCARTCQLCSQKHIRQSTRTPSARLTAGEAAEARVELARRASRIESKCGHGEPRG